MYLRTIRGDTEWVGKKKASEWGNFLISGMWL